MGNIFKGLRVVFKKNKTALYLNIVGLAVAFTAFLVILMRVGYEYDFDRVHPTSERVYRVDTDKEGIWGIIHPRAFVEAIISSSPYIEAGTLVTPSYNLPTYFTVEQDGKKTGFKEIVTTTHPDVTKVFDFPVIQGSIDCLNDPEKVLIPESLAQKIYGTEPAVGKTLHVEETIWTKTGREFTIGGVYKDFPGNTQLNNTIYTAMDASHDINNWDASNYVCYVLLTDKNAASQVEENFNTNFNFENLSDWDDNRIKSRITLVPLTDIYYFKERTADTIVKSGSRELSFLLIGIAFLILIIACINFTNFSTALAPLRVKSINTRKVLGSTDKVLKIELIREAVLISFLSFLIAIGLIMAVEQTSLLSFIEADLNIMHYPGLLIGILCLSVIVGLIAGFYPARYITSFPPALVLKGNFALSPKGRRLRTSLIGFQFVISIVLIILSLFIQYQQHYMRNFAVGFDREQVAIVELNNNFYTHNKDVYADKLKAYTGIEDVAFCRSKLGGQDGYPTYRMYIAQAQEYAPYYRIEVSPNFLSVMNISLIEGREPDKMIEQTEKPAFIINNLAKSTYGLESGIQNLFGENSRDEILGFVGNIKISSLRQEVQNMVFAFNTKNPMPYSYVRLKKGIDHNAAIEHIRNTITEIEPGFPVEIEFYDTVFNQLYQKEETMNRMITLFSVLAILISIVGVFGMILFETQCRRKEIGIRKVFGADVSEILYLFSRTYLHVVIICFIIAVPISYYGVSQWLQNFAYKVSMQWWMFGLAFLITIFVTLFTVTIQNLRAALANPVDSIQTE